MKFCIGFIALFYINLLFPDNLNFYLEDNKTSSFILFHEGKIKVEKEFVVNEPSDFYKIASEGNVDKRSLEDVASIQKSIVSLLIGIAQQKGYLNINDSVSSFLGRWTKYKKNDLM